MKIRFIWIGLLSLAVATPVWAGFTATDFQVSGDSRVGLANGFSRPPTGFTGITAQQVDSTQAPVAPVPGPTGTETFDTSATAGALSGDRRNAGTTGAINGQADVNETLTLKVSSFGTAANNVNTTSHYKSSATSVASFTGEFTVGQSFPGVVIAYDGIYSMQAFAQNNAPGGSDNNSGWSGVEAVLRVDNVTTSIMEGESAFVQEMISQVYCGPTGQCFPNNSFNNAFSGVAFVPVLGASAGDVIRVTIEATAMSEAYAKAFNDPTGRRQTAGGIASASFDELNVTFLLIPEPASLALLLVGVGAIRLTRRRAGRC